MEKTLEYIEHTSGNRVRKSVKIGQITLLGKSHKQSLTPVEQLILKQKCVTAYNKFCFSKDVFYSTFYTRAKQTNDTMVCLNDGTFGQITVIYVSDENSVRLLLKKFCVEQVQYPRHLKRVVRAEIDCYEDVPADEILEKCLVVDTSTDSYISVLPNRFESD